jgi:hypothetical protein
MFTILLPLCILKVDQDGIKEGVGLHHIIIF